MKVLAVLGLMLATVAAFTLHHLDGHIGTIQIEGQSAEVKIGEDGELTCTARTNKRPLFVTWERVDAEAQAGNKEAQPLEASSQQVTGRPWTWTLKFSAVTVGDEGTYRCKIQTADGERGAVDVHLGVVMLPIVRAYEDATTITCSVISLPESRIWIDDVTSPQGISTYMNSDGTWTSTATVTLSDLEKPIGDTVTCVVTYKNTTTKYKFPRPVGHSDGTQHGDDYFTDSDDE